MIFQKQSLITLFCYDHFLNLETSQLTLYAKNEKCEAFQIDFRNVPIWMDVQINYFLKENSTQWQSQIEQLNLPKDNTKKITNQSQQLAQGQQQVFQNQSQYAKLFTIIEKIEVIDKKIFKGYCSELENKPHHIRVHFKSFTNYKKFKQILGTLNEFLCNPEKKFSKIENDIYEANKDIILFVKNLYDIQQSKPNPIFKLSEDDLPENYICKLQRQYQFLLAGWNIISDFSQLNENSLLAELQNIKFVENQKNSPISILTWDIEVSTKSGFFESNGYTPDNRIICIGCSLFDNYSNKIKKYCITQVQYKIPNQTYEINQGENDVEIIYTPNEKNTILQFADLICRTKPMIITGFNDFMFDWPFVEGRIRYFEIFQEFCKRISPSVYQFLGIGKLFKSTEMKVDQSQKRLCTYPIIHGSICVDTRVVLIKIQKLEKKSLNDYLHANGISLKLDVDFKEMNASFKKFMDTNKSNIQLHDHQTMHNVMKYCAHDADSCRALWNKLNVIMEHIEVANLSFTPLSYAFYNANGIKVRNMVAYEAGKLGFSMPMSYTSFNYRTKDIKAVEFYEKYPGAHVAKPKKGINSTPVIALDFESLYPSIIMAHQLSPEKIIISKDGNLVKTPIKENDLEIKFNFEGEENLELQNVIGYVKQDQQIAIYPYILQDLFAKRKNIKNKIAELSKLPETVEINFQIKLLNAKQLALKIYMNTFYGEAGKKESPFFDLLVAGGTTYFGRKYIQQTHEFVGNMDCEIIYGDTDSLYLRPRFSQYQLKSKSVNTYDLIKESFIIAEQIQKKVNLLIGQQTNNKLKMAFEEVLCPSFFTGKKKYCGVAFTTPEQKQNIRIQDVLIKGIDFIKSNYPSLVKKMGQQLILEIMNQSASFEKKITNLEEIFEDDYRQKYQNNLQQMIIQQVIAFKTQVESLKQDQYDQLVVQKKIKKESKGGLMKLFSERLVEKSEKYKLLDILQKKNFDEASQEFIEKCNILELYFQIDEQQLKKMGIEIPQFGEQIDILYVKDNYAVDNFQQLHLFDFVQKQGIKIEVREYMKMFNTTANRLLMSTFEDDEETVQMNKASSLTTPLMPPPNSKKIAVDKSIHEQFMLDLFTDFTKIYEDSGFKIKDGNQYLIEYSTTMLPFTKVFDSDTIFSKKFQKSLGGKTANKQSISAIIASNNLTIQRFKLKYAIKLFKFYLNNIQKLLVSESMFCIPEDDSYVQGLIYQLQKYRQEIISYLYQIDIKLTLDFIMKDKIQIATWSQILKSI